MADTSKEGGFVGRMVQQQARRMVIKKTEEQMQQLNVSLHNFKEDIERIEKVSKRAAAKLVKQAQALGWVKDDLTAIPEVYKRDRADMSVANQKLQEWGKRFGWLKTVVQHHAAEITAAAGVGLAFKNALEQYTTATTQLVQTTGQLGNNALEAAKRADDLSDAYVISVENMGKFGIAADQAKAAAAELVKLYGGKAVKGTPDFTEAMETIASMSRVTGKSTDEITALYRKRFLEQGRTMKQTNLEMANVTASYEDLRGAQERLQAGGANIALMMKTDFHKAVQEAADEISPMTADMDKVAKMSKAAAESASKLGLQLSDINKISAQIGKALKLPAAMEFEIGREVLQDIMAKRESSTDAEFDVFLKANFKGTEQQVRKAVEDFQRKGPDALSEWNVSQMILQAGAGQGLVMGKKLKKAQELAQNTELFVRMMSDTFGGDMKLTLVAREVLARGGTMEEVAKKMEAEAKAAGSEDKEAQARAAKAAELARGQIKRQHEAGKTWLDTWKATLLAQFQSPIRSLIITVGGLGAWALMNVISNKLMAGQVAIVARNSEVAAVAAASAGSPALAASAGSTAGKVGGWFSRHPATGSALAVGAVASLGYFGMSQMSTSDPDKMRKELEKSLNLSPGDLERYSSPEKIQAQMAADAIQGERKPGVGAVTGAGGAPLDPGAITQDVLSGKHGVYAAYRARAAVAKKQQEQKDIETAGSGVPGLLSMGLGTYVAQAATSARGWLAGDAKNSIPDKPEGYSALQLQRLSELVASLPAMALERPGLKRRIEELNVQNLELRLRRYDELMAGAGSAGSRADYLKSAEAKKHLDAIRQLSGDSWAEHTRQLVEKGGLGEQAAKTREQLSRATGVKVGAALGAQEQQRPAGKELMIGPDGRPLTSLSQAMLRMRFQANQFDESTGALVCEWTNPQIVSTIFQAVRLQAQGGKAAAPKRGD